MKIKVTATAILDTNKIPATDMVVRTTIEQEALNKGSNRIGRLWAWQEVEKQNILDITLELL